MFSEGVISWLQRFSFPWLDQFFLGVTSLGSEYVYFVILTLIYWCINRRSGRTLLLAFLASVWLNSVLKDAIGMGRPSADLVRVMSYEWSSGFPSGHAQNAAVVWTYLALRWPKRWLVILSGVVVTLVSLSRLYLGMHFVGQVLVGLLLGFVIAVVAFWWERKGRLFAQPSWWRAALIALASYIAAIPVQSDDGFRIGGVLLGFLLTDAVPRQTYGYVPACEMHSVMQINLPWLKQVGRALVGWIGFGLGFITIKTFAAPGLPTMLGYAALAVWVTSGAPALFRWFRLGQWQQRATEPVATPYPIPAEVPVPGVVSLAPSTSPLLAAGFFLLIAVGLTLPGVPMAKPAANSVAATAEGIAMPATNPELPAEEAFLVFAHKGGEGLAPGNTLAAFGNGLQLGANVIECDVRRSLDEALVVIHDAKVDEVTNGTGAVSALTLRELRALDAGYRFTTDQVTYPYRDKNIRIPTLETALRAYPTARFNIDMKDHSTDMPHALLSVLDATEARNRVIVASFDGPTIRRFRQLAPDVPTSLANDEVVRFVVLTRLGLGAFYKPPARYLQIPERQGPIQLATPSMIKLAHRLGMDVHVWTVNDRSAMRRLIAAGVDGIITDYPDRLQDVLAGKATDKE